MLEPNTLPVSSWFFALQPLSEARNNIAPWTLRRQLDLFYLTAWLMKHQVSRQNGGALDHGDRHLEYVQRLSAPLLPLVFSI
jgi:hypothetical protein